MENANSRDYLDKILVQVIENLRQTAHAPSVQMTDVPRTDMHGVADNEDEDAELDDFDEDVNKDSRITKRQREKHVEREEEFYDSDYERDQTSGPHTQNGQRKRRNITDYKNPYAAPDDIDMDSGLATPEVQNHVEEATAMITDVNAEVNDEIMEKKLLDPSAVELGEKGPSNAPSRADSVKGTVINADADVHMSDAGEAEPPTAAAVPGTLEPSEPKPVTVDNSSNNVDQAKHQVEKVTSEAVPSS